MQLERPLPPLPTMPKPPGAGMSKKAKKRRNKRVKELITEATQIEQMSKAKAPRKRNKPKKQAQPILYKRPMTRTKVIGTGVVVDPLRASFRRQANDKHCRCEGTDFLGYVVAPPAGELTLGQALYAQSLNPSLWQGTRVSQEAKLWERFRFQDVVIVFQSEYGTNAKGQLVAYIDPDPVAQVAEDVPSAWARENRVTFNAWETAYMPYPVDPEFTDLFVGPTGEDPRLSSAGNVYVLYNGGFVNTEEEAVYTVAVQYKIEFWNAKSKTESDEPVAEIVNGSMDLSAKRRRKLSVPGDALFQGATKILDTLGVTISNDGKISIPVTNIGQNKLFIGIDLNSSAGDSVTRAFEVEDNMTGATLDESSTAEMVVQGGSTGNLFSWSGLASAVSTAGQVIIDAALSEVGAEIITEGASLLLTLLPALLARSAKKSPMGTFPYLLTQREFVRRLSPRHLCSLNIKYSRIPKSVSSVTDKEASIHVSRITGDFGSLNTVVTLQNYVVVQQGGFDITYTGAGNAFQRFTLDRAMATDEMAVIIHEFSLVSTGAADLTTLDVIWDGIPAPNHSVSQPSKITFSGASQLSYVAAVTRVFDLPAGSYSCVAALSGAGTALNNIDTEDMTVYWMYLSKLSASDKKILSRLRKTK